MARAQIENDQTLVAHHTGKPCFEIILEPGVVIEPPERLPGKDDESRSGKAPALELLRRRGGVGGRSAKLSIRLRKRESPAPRDPTAGGPVVLVNEDEGPAVRDLRLH